MRDVTTAYDLIVAVARRIRRVLAAQAHPSRRDSRDLICARRDQASACA